MGDAKEARFSLMKHDVSAQAPLAWLDHIANLKTRYGMDYNRHSPLIQPQFVVEKLSEITGGRAIVSTGAGQRQFTFPLRPPSWTESTR